MITHTIFYHAGCSVCVAAEHIVSGALDPAKYTVESVRARTSTPRLKEARRCQSQVRPSVCDEWRGISHGLRCRHRHRAG